MLPPRGAPRLSADDIQQLQPGTWIEERLNANTVQCERTEALAFGRPREVVEILRCAVTKRGRWYANLSISFAGGLAALTLVEGDVRFRVRREPVDLFDLVRFGRAAESSHAVADF